MAVMPLGSAAGEMTVGEGLTASPLAIVQSLMFWTMASCSVSLSDGGYCLSVTAAMIEAIVCPAYRRMRRYVRRYVTGGEGKDIEKKLTMAKSGLIKSQGL